jgi:hypothetical protein
MQETFDVLQRVVAVNGNAQPAGMLHDVDTLRVQRSIQAGVFNGHICQRDLVPGAHRLRVLGDWS